MHRLCLGLPPKREHTTARKAGVCSQVCVRGLGCVLHCAFGLTTELVGHTIRNGFDRPSNAQPKATTGPKRPNPTQPNAPPGHARPRPTLPTVGPMSLNCKQPVGHTWATPASVTWQRVPRQCKQSEHWDATLRCCKSVPRRRQPQAKQPCRAELGAADASQRQNWSATRGIDRPTRPRAPDPTSPARPRPIPPHSTPHSPARFMTDLPSRNERFIPVTNLMP